MDKTNTEEKEEITRETLAEWTAHLHNRVTQLEQLLAAHKHMTNGEVVLPYMPTGDQD